jgi:predicted nucleic acid-binding protein
MTNPLANFSEEAIYLDTMVPYALLRGIDPATKTFFQRLEVGEFQAFTSALTFDELAYRLILALIKDQYPGSPLDHLRDREEEMLAEFSPPVAAQLERLQKFPNLMIVGVRVDDLTEMNRAMEQYHVRPRDALHYAAMQRVNCFNLASNDRHFDRIPGLQRFIF